MRWRRSLRKHVRPSRGGEVGRMCPPPSGRIRETQLPGDDRVAGARVVGSASRSPAADRAAGGRPLVQPRRPRDVPEQLQPQRPLSAGGPSTVPLPTATYTTSRPPAQTAEHLRPRLRPRGPGALGHRQRRARASAPRAASAPSTRRASDTVVGQIAARAPTGPGPARNFAGMKSHHEQPPLLRGHRDLRVSTLWTLDTTTCNATKIGTGTIAGFVIDIAIDRTEIPRTATRS